MKQSDIIAARAGDNLLRTIQSLEELCIAREKDKMSYLKYRRMITELKDLSRLLAIYNGYGVEK